MRFLNRKWAEGGYDDQTTYMYWTVYQRHFESIAPDLPRNARALGAITRGQHLVGAQVAATSLNREKGSFHLVLRLATVDGEAYLDITYRGVDPDAIDEHAFDKVDYLLTDELDMAPNELFEHRYLLSPEGEFAIQFRDMDLKLTPAGEEE
jgi:hypothetical protein